MANRKIPIHSFYISDGSGSGSGSENAKTYFTKRSMETKGEASEYDLRGTNEAEKLTNFIVENILNRIGGERLGRELVQAYHQLLRFGR